jgi:SAM-dependent methyltransferase
MDTKSAADALRASYDDYPRIEETFQAMLDESLRPRAPDTLFDIVASLGLPRGARALDLGCGEGGYTLQLAQRFGFDVLGIDPVLRPPTGERHIALVDDARAAASSLSEDLRRRIAFAEATAGALPVADASIDIIWSREMVVLVEDVEAMLAECRRAMRPGGYLLVEGTFATDRMEPGELARFDSTAPAFGSSDPHRVEHAIAASALELVERIDFTSEWGEFSHEARGVAGRRLIHAARLLRDPQRYIDAFGQTNYDIMLADCFWHVYRMIGKLGGRLFVLRKVA